MHDDSINVFVVETTCHIVLAPAGAGSLLGSIFSMNIPAHAVKPAGDDTSAGKTVQTLF
jgi:hypothetical protein